MAEPAVPDPTDTPAVALGPTALVLGVISAIGPWTPAPGFAVIAGALAVTFGVAGVHHARNGTGRLWTAIAGTTLGTIALTGPITLLWALSA